MFYWIRDLESEQPGCADDCKKTLESGGTRKCLSWAYLEMRQGAAPTLRPPERAHYSHPAHAHAHTLAAASSTAATATAARHRCLLCRVMFFGKRCDASPVLSTSIAMPTTRPTHAVVQPTIIATILVGCCE